MKHSVFKSFLLISTTCALIGLTACLRAEDPEPQDPKGLTNPYCNDPRAANYNRGFPGIPDSSTCVYPIDYFVGEWQLEDSIFYKDNTPPDFQIRTLHFESTEDTSLTHLKLLGLCTSSQALLLTADKYQNAEIDSTGRYLAGQIFCDQSDTVTGSFRYDFLRKDTILMELEVKGPTAKNHKGIIYKKP